MYELNLPVKLIFGRGSQTLVGEKAQTLGRQALIVTGKSSGLSGSLQMTTDLLGAAGVDPLTFDRIRANPLVSTVMEGAYLARQEKCDLIIGLGGGSALDAAKAIAFMAVNPGDIRQYVWEGREGEGALPIIAIPTTPGSGSEANKAAVLSDPEISGKKSLKHPSLYPSYSLVDPDLMSSLPPSIIAACGFDAFSHALESFLSLKTTPLSEMIALTALRYINENLPVIYRNPQNRQSWDMVAWSGSLGGWALDLTGAGPLHGLEHPISGLLDVTHGLGLAALTRPILKLTLPFSEESAKLGARVMGRDGRSALEFLDSINDLLAAVDLLPSLAELGVGPEQLPWVIDQAIKFNGHSLNNCHHPKLSAEVLLEALSRA